MFLKIGKWTALVSISQQTRSRQGQAQEFGLWFMVFLGLLLLTQVDSGYQLGFFYAEQVEGVILGHFYSLRFFTRDFIDNEIRFLQGFGT